MALSDCCLAGTSKYHETQIRQRHGAEVQGTRMTSVPHPKPYFAFYKYPPLSEQRKVLFRQLFGTFPLFGQGGAGLLSCRAADAQCHSPREDNPSGSMCSVLQQALQTLLDTDVRLTCQPIALVSCICCLVSNGEVPYSHPFSYPAPPTLSSVWCD